jgi:hypothetical protein
MAEPHRLPNAVLRACSITTLPFKTKSSKFHRRAQSDADVFRASLKSPTRIYEPKTRNPREFPYSINESILYVVLL